MDQRPIHPVVELFEVALPTVAQMASYTVMQFIDTWMLSRVSESAPVAAGNSGMFAFSVVSFGMGIILLVNTFVSQSFGRQDYPLCGRYLWQGIWVALGLGLLGLPLLFLGHPLFALFGHPPALAAQEALYWQIIFLAMPFKLLGMAMGNFCIGINRANVVLISTLLGVGNNALAAYALVLGHFGFARHGVAGAAWAQNIGAFCELAVLAVFVFWPSIRRKFSTLDYPVRSRELTQLVRIGLPSGLQWISDVLSWSLFCNLVVGILGVQAMAANTFMMRYMMISFMPVIGIGTAVTALVGRYIGKGEPDTAVARTHLAYAANLIYVVVIGIVFIAYRQTLIGMFTTDPDIIRIGSQYMIICAIYEMTDATYLTYSGALRGAGDTLIPAIAMGVLCWTITVGGGYWAARHLPMLGATGPWMFATLYGLLLGLFNFLRFRAGRWRKLVLNPAQLPADALINPIPMGSSALGPTLECTPGIR